MLYQRIIKPILFKFDAEMVHDFTLGILSLLNKSQKLNNWIFHHLNYSSERLRQKLFGLYFRTPIGLAAGMDKKAAAPLLWSAFDFGWAELGSFTNQAHQGNARPRLWRLVKEQGIIVHSGLPNEGADFIAAKLKREKKRYPKRGLWGISIAKSPRLSLDEAPADFAQSFIKLSPLADMITINLSCPNVEDFAGLQNPVRLEGILQKITSINNQAKPIFIKVGNDLDETTLNSITDLVKKYKITGIIAANLSKKRDNFKLAPKHQDKPGGISGRLIADRANKIIAHLYKRSEGKYIVIGCGGIFNGADAFGKIKAGASLLQLVTGFIYGGPYSIKNINKELDQLLIQNNFKHLSQAVGIEANKYNL